MTSVKGLMNPKGSELQGEDHCSGGRGTGLDSESRKQAGILSEISEISPLIPNNQVAKEKEKTELRNDGKGANFLGENGKLHVLWVTFGQYMFVCPK